MSPNFRSSEFNILAVDLCEYWKQKHPQKGLFICYKYISFCAFCQDFQDFHPPAGGFFFDTKRKGFHGMEPPILSSSIIFISDR